LDSVLFCSYEQQPDIMSAVEPHPIYLGGTGSSTYGLISVVLSAYCHCFNYINIQLCHCSTTVVVITSTMVITDVSCRRPERWTAVQRCSL